MLVLFLGFVGPSRVRVPVPVGEVLGGWCYYFQRYFFIFLHNFVLFLEALLNGNGSSRFENFAEAQVSPALPGTLLTALYPSRMVPHHAAVGCRV